MDDKSSEDCKNNISLLQSLQNPNPQTLNSYNHSNTLFLITYGLF
jgi:hypothetical protein